MASHLGFLGGSDTAFYIFQVGSALEGFLLSIGLAVRLNRQLKARSEAERRALQMTARMQSQTIEDQERNARELEKHVEVRTYELREALGELAGANQELQRLSTTDPLTGLYNRRFLTEELEQTWNLASRNQWPVSLLMLDIDHFKNVNDTWGHGIGDQCLREFAAILSLEVKRPSDIVARLGGEEFVAVLPDTYLSGAQHVAERIRSSVATLRIRTGENELFFTVSIGVASRIPGQNHTAEELLRQADHALYEAKNDGRNKVCTHENSNLE
jgi:diguanylate cyclase (GGDEF)-like protein